MACLNSTAVYVDPIQDDVKTRIYAQLIMLAEHILAEQVSVLSASLSGLLD